MFQKGNTEEKRFLYAYGIETIWCYYDETGSMIGGAEYVPTSLVPYDIPKHETSAFLTCVYPTIEQYDYKSAPLTYLE